MTTRNLSDPVTLLAELKSRHGQKKSVNDLLDHIISVVEATVRQPHPDYLVRLRLLLWAGNPELLKSQTEHWMLTNDQRATLARAFEESKR